MDYFQNKFYILMVWGKKNNYCNWKLVLYTVIIIIIILLNNLNLKLQERCIHNPHVATLIEVGCITYNKIQQKNIIIKIR